MLITETLTLILKAELHSHILRQRLITKLVYSIELEIKYTTDTTRSASYIDVHLEMDSECWLRTNIYDRIDYLNFPIVNLYVATFLKNLHTVANTYLSVNTILQSLWFISSCGTVALMVL